MGFDPVAYALGAKGAPVRGDLVSWLMGKAAGGGWHLDDGTKLTFGQYDNIADSLIKGGTDLLTVRPANSREPFNSGKSYYENTYNGSSNCGVRIKGGTFYGVRATGTGEHDHVYVALYTEPGENVACIGGIRNGEFKVVYEWTQDVFDTIFGDAIN